MHAERRSLGRTQFARECPLGVLCQPSRVIQNSRLDKLPPNNSLSAVMPKDACGSKPISCWPPFHSLEVAITVTDNAPSSSGSEATPDVDKHAPAKISLSSVTAPCTTSDKSRGSPWTVGDASGGSYFFDLPALIPSARTLRNAARIASVARGSSHWVVQCSVEPQKSQFLLDSSGFLPSPPLACAPFLVSLPGPLPPLPAPLPLPPPF